MRPATVVVRLGALLLVVGLVAVAWGGYAQATNPCESGYYLSVDRLDSNESPPPSDDRVDFADLPPAERQVFLDAVDAAGGTSREDARRSVIDDLSHHVVAYRGDEYVTNAMVADCGPQPLETFGPVGVLVSVLGSVGIVVGLAWRRVRPAP